MKVCKKCGKELVGRQQIFCSKSCSISYRNVILPPQLGNKIPRIKYICKECGSKFESLEKDRIFCSHRCVTTWNHRVKGSLFNAPSDFHSKGGKCQKGVPEKDWVKKQTSEIMTRYYFLYPEKHLNWILAGSKGRKKLWDQLRDQGIIPPKEYEGFTDELREYIRNKYDRKCFDCGKFEKDNKQRLSVHHIDGDKKNFQEDNLVPLCKGCHAKKYKVNNIGKKDLLSIGVIQGGI